MNMYIYTVPGTAFISGFYQREGKCLVPKLKRQLHMDDYVYIHVLPKGEDPSPLPPLGK